MAETFLCINIHIREWLGFLPLGQGLRGPEGGSLRGRGRAQTTGRGGCD